MENDKIKFEYQLSTQEMSKIVAEEKFKLTLQDQTIELKTAKKNKIWTFLNSSFGLFILSSVLVTGISSFISRELQSQSEKREERKAILRYLVELDCRISNIDYLIDKLDTAKNEKFKTSMGVTITWAINGTDGYTPSQPEFKNQKIISLITWFKYNVAGTKIDSAYNRTLTFEELKDDNWIYDIKKSKETLQTMKVLRDEIKNQLDKW